jgi:glyoxylase-like metal-dependent hydrolase (beta-lactamase superfamily II)
MTGRYQRAPNADRRDASLRGVEGPVRLGRYELVPLLDGAELLDDPLDQYFPGVPAGAVHEVHERWPALVGSQGQWRLHVRCTLIRSPDITVLVDTGVGGADAPGFSWFHRAGRLIDELAASGTPRDAVDMVVITHVHDDHIGGTTAEGGPAFPRARFLIQQADLTWQRAWAAKEEEDRIIDEQLLRPLERAGVLEVADGDAEVAEGIRVRLAPGHTPGHQIVEVRGDDGSTAVISGDTFNLPAQLAHPDGHGSSDDDPASAAATRRAVIEELVQRDVLVAPSHFAEPFGRLATDEDGRPTWTPLIG